MHVTAALITAAHGAISDAPDFDASLFRARLTEFQAPEVQPAIAEAIDQYIGDYPIVGLVLMGRIVTVERFALPPFTLRSIYDLARQLDGAEYEEAWPESHRLLSRMETLEKGE
jgi:hypothetical protein